MPIKPNLTVWGNSFAPYAGKGLNDATDTAGEIEIDKLNKTTMVDGVEFTHFETVIRDFILARLGHPVVRVELTPFQIKTCIDEAVSTMYNHAPFFSTQIATFEVTIGQNLYEIPSYIANNLEYVVYKKSLLSIQHSAGTLEFDFFIKYFQDNYLLGQYNVGDYYLLQQSLEMYRKVFGQEGSFTLMDNRYLNIEPKPVTADTVILMYRGLNSNTIHPAYTNWIQQYALAAAKGVLGQSRGKFAVVPSPGGGAQLNGEQLQQQSAEEQDKLIKRLVEEFEEPPRFSTY